ncbi:MAG: S1C family serine protease [Planctomycetes bacterium]|nr:S1C family serine protease [Planctomycetota bacterium]
MNKYIFAALCIIISTAISVTFSGSENISSKTGKSKFLYDPIKIYSESRVFDESTFQMTDSDKTEPAENSDEKPEEKREEKYPTLKSFEREMIEIAEKAQKSSVRIIVLSKIDGDNKGTKVPEKSNGNNTVESFGSFTLLNFSGVIVNKDGYILTLAQPLHDADQILVNFDSQSFNAEVWAIDEVSKLAIIKIDKTDLSEIEFSEDDNIKTGSLAIVCGNPYGLTTSIKSTTVSGTNRIMYIGKKPFFGVIQINSATNPGDPGGLCMNSNGELMGIVWSSYFKDQMQEQKNLSERILKIIDKIVRPEMKSIAKQVVEEIVNELSMKYDNAAVFGSDRISFVLPANQLKKISENLIEFKRVKRVFVGIILSFQYDMKTESKRIVIREVTKDSPADKFGLKVGDEVLLVNNKPLKNLMMLYKLMSLSEPGEELILQIKRGNEEISIKLILGERKD